MKKIIIVILVAISNLAIAQQSLYVVQTDDNVFNTISASSGNILSAVTLELADTSPVYGLDVEVHPTSGLTYIVGSTSSESTSDRFLGIVNLNTGIVTNVGSMGDAVASFAFTSDGTLYAVTGDGATNDEELYTVNVTDGSMTFVMALGNGSDGETIVFNPNDGLLYHSSQDTIETIDLGTLTITAVTSGSDIAEITGMGYNSNDPNGGLLVIDRSEDLYTVSPLGVVTLILDDILGESGEFRGLSLAPPPPMIPSVNIYGVLLLGLGVLMMAMFGRKKIHI